MFSHTAERYVSIQQVGDFQSQPQFHSSISTGYHQSQFGIIVFNPGPSSLVIKLLLMMLTRLRAGLTMSKILPTYFNSMTNSYSIIMAFREEYNSFEREPMRRLHIQREREPVYIAADRQRDREEEYLRAQNAARDRDQFAHRSSGNYDGGPSDRGFGRGVFSVGRHEVKRGRKNDNRFNSNEIFRHRLISGYYQTGEGVGAVETLLPEDSDDEGPRRWSSLGEQGGGCLHQRQGKKARPSSGKLAEDPEKCLCGEDKIPKFVK